MEDAPTWVWTFVALAQPGFRFTVGEETLAPCGWGDREWSFVARLHCQAEYPYVSGSGQWSR